MKDIFQSVAKHYLICICYFFEYVTFEGLTVLTRSAVFRM
jgi:hypothetical protein